MNTLVFLLVTFQALTQQISCSTYPYKTRYFEQTVDHFNFQNSFTFKQRYLVADQWWNKTSEGPIFFYTGNEGSIENFATNTGFMWDIAPEFGAMLVFAEHRFYGKSIPFGKKSFTNIKYLGYLSVEQVLADFADLIIHLKQSIPGAQNSSVVVIGGSYGGFLAALFRMKYPNLVIGALASSPPILQFPGIYPCETFKLLTTESYQREGDQCPKSIRQAFKVISQMGFSHSGRQELSSIFHLCAPLKDSSDTMNLMNWLTHILENTALVNYPYPAKFMGSLPAWPVKVICSYLTNASQEPIQLLTEFSKAINIYNSTGSKKCWKMDAGKPKLRKQAWPFQRCAELVFLTCSNGVQDMFYYSPWNLTSYSNDCKQKYNVVTRPDHIPKLFGVTDLSSHSNIVFSNGLLDPIRGGSVLKNVSDTVIALLIEDAAHHLDLRSANPADPPSVTQARNIERMHIRTWLQQAKNKPKEVR